MAITQNNLIGAARGSIGGMVFTRLNGQNILRAKPSKRGKGKNFKLWQSRNNFKVVNKVFKKAQWLFTQGFREARNPASAFNYFVQQNIIKGFAQSTATTQVADWEKIQVSGGSGTKTPITPAAVIQGSGLLNVSWETSLINNRQKPTDTLFVLVVNLTLQEVCGKLSGTVQRSEGNATVDIIRPISSGNELLVCSFFRFDSVKISSIQHNSKITVS